MFLLRLHYERLMHLFYDCLIVKRIWNQLKSIISNNLNFLIPNAIFRFSNLDSNEHLKYKITTRLFKHLLSLRFSNDLWDFDALLFSELINLVSIFCINALSNLLCFYILFQELLLLDTEIIFFDRFHLIGFQMFCMFLLVREQLVIFEAFLCVLIFSSFSFSCHNFRFHQRIIIKKSHGNDGLSKELLPLTNYFHNAHVQCTNTQLLEYNLSAGVS